MTNDNGYDHSKLCNRCHGRGFEPSLSMSQHLRDKVPWILLGIAWGPLVWLTAILLGRLALSLLEVLH